MAKNLEYTHATVKNFAAAAPKVRRMYLSTEIHFTIS